MELIKVQEAKAVATVTLNRPELRNAFNPEMIQQIHETFVRLSSRHDLRAIVLQGEGKSFCAGGDLNWMKDMVKYSYEQNKEDAHRLFEMFESIYQCQVPVVGVIHGAAFGGALGLMACCDYVICEEKTQLCFSEVKLGIVPAVISAFVLKKCSLGQVSPLMLLGQVFNAQQAKDAGLVHEICDEEALPDQLETAVNWLKDVGPEAVRATKGLLHSLSALNWADSKDETAETIAERRVSHEGQEGLNSFLEKRKPSWGRR